MPSNLHFILVRVSEGDADAFRELFENFSPKVYGFASKLTHSEAMAEELVQEVFLKIWVNRESMNEIENFPAYLYTITRNLALNLLRRLSIEARVKAEFSKGLRTDLIETEESVTHCDYQRILKSAIDRLSPQQRMVYSLCHGQGLKYDEAAKKLQISRLTVKTHMQHALRNIKLYVSRVIAVFGALAIALL